MPYEILPQNASTSALGTCSTWDATHYALVQVWRRGRYTHRRLLGRYETKARAWLARDREERR